MLDGERVVRLVEKPTEFVSDIALVGVYLFDDSILEACASLVPSWRGEYEITEAIQWLVDHGTTVRAEMVEGWWKDTGKPDDLLEANRIMLSRAHVRACEGEVDAATVGSRGTSWWATARRSPPASCVGRCVIGAGASRGVLDDLGPTSRSSATAASSAARSPTRS